MLGEGSDADRQAPILAMDALIKRRRPLASRSGRTTRVNSTIARCLPEVSFFSLWLQSLGG